MAEPHFDDGVLAPEKEKQILKRPPLYTVVILNDDFTTIDFVVDVLVRHFGKGEEEAFQIMSDVHEKGKGVAGIYPKDIAETKVAIVRDEAQSEGYPLLLDIEENESD